MTLSRVEKLASDNTQRVSRLMQPRRWTGKYPGTANAPSIINATWNYMNLPSCLDWLQFPSNNEPARMELTISSSHSLGMNCRHVAWSQVIPTRSFSWWQVTLLRQVVTQKYAPVSRRALCAVTTLWCCGLSKNSPNTEFSFFSSRETCSLEPETLLFWQSETSLAGVNVETDFQSQKSVIYFLAHGEQE